MSRHAAPQYTLGPRAIATVAALAVAGAGLAAGIAVFWATTVGDPAAITHTLGVALILAAILTDIAWMTRTSAALCRAYRRQP